MLHSAALILKIKKKNWVGIVNGTQLAVINIGAHAFTIFLAFPEKNSIFDH
jgi:hypothetical protein